MNDMTPDQNELQGQSEQQELSDQMKRRREETEELRSLGINPYPYEYEVTHYSKDIIDAYTEGQTEQTVVTVAGRIMAIRKMGKASFCHILDSKGKIQIYLKKDDLDNVYEAFRLFDIGDIIGVTGFVFKTRTGEITIHARSLVLLSKSLRPLPVVKERIDETGATILFDPLSDKELRYRQRYVDLLVSPGVRDVFMKRAKMISTMRSFLDTRGYLEVETPILQPIYGGASAKPFMTHYNALDSRFYLRIADELYLKRLIVGGYDGVYEISKDFRNEGMDRTHNPEFTMLELYVAYKDYRWMMELTEQMIAETAIAVNGSVILDIGLHRIDFTPPWKRLPMLDAIKVHTGLDVSEKSEAELRSHCKDLGVETTSSMGIGALIDAIFSVKVQEHLVQPTFIIDYPVELSPLAKRHRSNPKLVERFEGYVNGKEICNAFSELNDPIDQRLRFEEQKKLLERGDAEAQLLDEDFLRAMEYGMPPTAGLGIGIDRLTMLMTNQQSIRDVIFFPQMKIER